MSTRILTGVLTPKAGFLNGGEAVILFNANGSPNVLGDANGLELNASGPDGEYAQPPGKIVSLREIKVSDEVVDANGDHLDTFSLNDGVPNEHNMTVSWSTSNGGEIREISFMIVGDVA
jgi:hypothetical protein